MVSRIALRPLLRFLRSGGAERSWAELKPLLRERLFPAPKWHPKENGPRPPALFRMATGYWLSQAIYVAAKLGIADYLKDGPRSCAALASLTGCDASALFRLLRALSDFGLFSSIGGDPFAITNASEPLQSDVPGSLRDILITIGEIHYQACGDLLHSIHTGSPVFKEVFGCGLFPSQMRGVVFDLSHSIEAPRQKLNPLLLRRRRFFRVNAVGREFVRALPSPPRLGRRSSNHNFEPLPPGHGR